MRPLKTLNLKGELKMATKTNQFVDDVEELPTSGQGTPTASVPPPAATSPVPTQQSTHPPAQAPTAPATVTAATVAASVDVDVEDTPTGAGATSAASSNKHEAEDYDVVFGDEALMSRSDGLEILRPEKGKTVRFALLTNYLPAKRVFNHYIEKKGTFHCLTSPKAMEPAVCCKQLGDSQPQIVALALQYTNANDKTGRYDKDADGKVAPIKWEIKYIRLSRSAFRRISGLVEEDGKPTDIDITMSHRDSGIGYEYNRISVARWARNPELVKEVEAAVQPFIADGGKKLLSKLGKKVSTLQFRAVLAGARVAGGADEADLSAVDDL
jgi:hypothetical protein